ncbi:D-aminoacyl-tRNA deacylase [Bacteroidia bacterium]|nr:D-aminoacyl-tRNA deacylase [Bacteroidia bacterium]
MRLLVQRVTRASVSIGGAVHSSIDRGLLVFVGIGYDDTTEDASWLASKAAGLRIFDDEDGVMNLDVRQIDGSVLVISQFTLMAMTRKGNRPSYVRAAGEPVAMPLYEYFLGAMSREAGGRVAAGVFGADMQVSLVNDGPVTIWIDSKNRE